MKLHPALQRVLPALMLVVLLNGIAVPGAMTALAAPAGQGGPDVSTAIHHDVSPALRGIHGPSPDVPGSKKDRPLRLLPNRGIALRQPEGALQTTVGPAVSTTNFRTFPGVGTGDYGFVPNAAPPDTNGAAGATQYVQWVNESFAVFNKATGALVYGPAAGNTLWSGFGGGCQTNNDGDIIVQYDQMANRWIMTQFSVSTKPYLQCVAVSTTSDATGSYYRYAFDYGSTGFPDYPKLGVWPDAYYITFNIFNNGITFAGAKVCAYDRNSMLQGLAATQQCFQTSTSYGGLLPSDMDGTTQPPAGSPNFVVAFGSNVLQLWNFHTDWVNTANTTFTGPTNIGVASFSPACSGGGACIPQSGTSNLLDSLADRLMYRLAYRNRSGTESLVVNHSVTAPAGNVGVRWYELRNAAPKTMAAATPVVYQQSTFSPDSTYRWMGSIAMDQAGDIALGYSASSSSVYPSIRYTGRVPTDARNTMQSETSILTGAGSQTGSLHRWGDYSAMSVDPVDDCTFWYTTEYLKSSGSFNWSTQIASFKFPSCGSPPVLTTITVSPSSASVQAGGTQQFAATGLDQFGQPLSPQPTFTWAVSGGGTINGSGLFTAGTTAGGPFTVTATSGSVQGTASVTVTSVPSDFSLSVSPGSQSVRRGSAATYLVTITPSNGFSGSVTLSLTGQPSGSTVTFTPNPATGTATLTVKTLTSTTRKTYTLTVKGVSGGLSHTTTASLTVTK